MDKLSPQDKALFVARVKRTRDVHERNRLCVVLARDEGHSPEVISRILQLDRTSVFEYLREYECAGKTAHDQKGGSQRKLSEEQLNILMKHLSQVTYLKAKNICAYVMETFGISYSPPGMVHLLRDNGFVYKKPLKVPTRLCPVKQEQFVEAYAKLKDTLKSDEEVYFGDATHPEYQSQAVFGWIKKGVQKTLQTTAKQERLHFLGAVRLEGMNVVTSEFDTIGSAETINFFQKLEAQSQASKIYLILDNARSNRNKEVEKYLKTSRIEVIYLPPYSPNLNPIERLWKLMRETTTYNKYYERFEVFASAVRKFFEEILNFREKLIERITDNFQKIHLDPIRNSV